MKGKYHFVIQNTAVKFQFDIDHNISIVRGNSATGKTTLVDMIRGYETSQESSGVSLQCSPECRCHVLEGITWKEQIKFYSGSILFIDEGNEFLSTKEFADAIHHTDNYYVIFSRHNLPMLPYSADAIYEIRKSGRYGKLKQTYNNFYRLYSSDENHAEVTKDMVDNLLVEDSGAGYQFWNKLAADDNLQCFSSRGKSNIQAALVNNRDKKMLIIADGAAFGTEMEKVYFYMSEYPGMIFLYLPESFEWILLKAELSKDGEVHDLLDRPYDFAETKKYDSWEQLFTAVLIRKTKDTYHKFQKKKLNPYYLEKIPLNKIRDVLKESKINL